MVRITIRAVGEGMLLEEEIETIPAISTRHLDPWYAQRLLEPPYDPTMFDVTVEHHPRSSMELVPKTGEGPMWGVEDESRLVCDYRDVNLVEQDTASAVDNMPSAG